MIHVCFCFYDKTGLYSKFAGTTMLSIFENANTPLLPSITVHILHDNTLTADNREKFMRLVGFYGQLVKFYNVEELCAEKIEEIYKLFPNVDKTRFSIGMFYRFFIPFVLPTTIEKAIYLDADIIANLDINELWDNDLGNKILGVVPALAIGHDIHPQDKVVRDGFVKPEDYFNSGVLLMNMNLLRGKEKFIIDGMDFVLEHKYLNLLDQTILNYCFSLQSLKLPVQFNQFVRWARAKKEPVMRKIYHYTYTSLKLNTNDPFNRLWMSYFVRTPWFDEEVMGRLYNAFLQIRTDLKNSALKLSAIMSGKTRAFFVEPAKVDSIKKAFSIRDDETIIFAENESSIQQLINAMKSAQGKCVFYIMTAKLLNKNFPFDLLTKDGFVENKDFVKGWNYLNSPFDSYPLITVM